jgi:hypothetical protein
VRGEGCSGQACKRENHLTDRRPPSEQDRPESGQDRTGGRDADLVESGRVLSCAAARRRRSDDAAPPGSSAASSPASASLAGGHGLVRGTVLPVWGACCTAVPI